jgi:glyoxylase-like metal-dependent hydrolase (beta-lactamase superfamily II)
LSRLIDLDHLGRPRRIAAWQVDDVLIDCGPASCLPTLLDAIAGEEPRVLLLTHIHLDHAAAAGELVERLPDLEVHVHPRGLRHLADPSRLVASARQIYGDDLERLWGRIEPVPVANLHELVDGGTAAGMRVAFTPGHANHHASFLDERTGTIFAGDAAGVKYPGVDLIVPPTPPPDIDLEAWLASIETLEAWDADRLAITHFDSIDDPAPHLGALRERLLEESELARTLSQAEYDERHVARIEAASPPRLRDQMHDALPPGGQWAGWDLYWQRRRPEAT